MKPTVTNILYMLSESNKIEDEYEQQQLDDALEAWGYLMTWDQISPSAIKEAHALLMKNTKLEKKYQGDFRDIPVWIGGEHKAQPKIIIESLIRDWCDETNKADKNFDPVTLHIRFEDIHPFVDGNGRIGRILLNWHLVKRNNAPLLVYTKENVRTYYRLFPSYRRKEREKMYELAVQFGKELHEKRNNNNAGLTGKASPRHIRKTGDAEV